MASAAVAGSWVEILPGHSHVAMSTGPKAFLAKVLPFLTAPVVLQPLALRRS